MKSYQQAIAAAAELGNMPDPNSKPGLYIIWAEDICELLCSIYERDYDAVCDDLRDKLVDLGTIDLSED